MSKKFYWLKLRESFFDSKQIKKLRRMAGGDTYTIIYLKMQLTALKTSGIIEYTGLESDFVDELALDLDENPDDVRMTLAFLNSCNLIETSDGINYFLHEVVENTGSESDSAQRVREYRERQKALPCNADVTKCNTEKREEKRENIEEKKEKKQKRRAAEKDTSYIDDMFERVWKLYPKKEGKHRVSKESKRKLYDAGEDTIVKAIENYKIKIEKDKTADKYIKHGSTFFNGDWQDFVGEPEQEIPDGYVLDKYGELMKMPIGRLLTPEECERLGRDY